MDFRDEEKPEKSASMQTILIRPRGVWISLFYSHSFSRRGDIDSWNCYVEGIRL